MARTLWNVEAIHPDPSVVTPGPPEKQHGQSRPRLFTATASTRISVTWEPACLNLEGKIFVAAARRQISSAAIHGNGGSPVLVDSELIFSCDGAENPFVTCLDANTGTVKWKTPRNTPANRKFSFSTPLVVDRGAAKQVISAGSGFIGGYDPATGREIWRVRYGNGYSALKCFAAGAVGRYALHQFRF